MRIEGFACDVCNVQKGPSNHWLLIGSTTEEFNVSPWNIDDAYGTDLFHICGESCAMKKLSEWFTEQRNAIPVEK